MSVPSTSATASGSSDALTSTPTKNSFVTCDRSGRVRTGLSIFVAQRCLQKKRCCPDKPITLRRTARHETRGPLALPSTFRGSGANLRRSYSTTEHTSRPEALKLPTPQSPIRTVSDHEGRNKTGHVPKAGDERLEAVARSLAFARIAADPHTSVQDLPRRNEPSSPNNSLNVPVAVTAEGGEDRAVSLEDCAICSDSSEGATLVPHDLQVLLLDLSITSH